MGQKTHPIGLRLGITETWRSRWYADKDYAVFLHEDIALKKYIKEKLYQAGIAKVEVERTPNRARINIYAARPGIIIGRKGSEIEKLRGELEKKTQKQIFINIVEVKRPELNAQLVAESVAAAMEKRVGFRRALKKAVATAMKLGAQGIRIACSGRLDGAEMARYEWYRQGRVPLHTLRAKIDYGTAEVNTKYGKVGIKTWIFNGEVYKESPRGSVGKNTERVS
ncbi:MAG: 30S ribosomal protein S3, partial [bacterium]|nr:30S ribosomal protein S3 [bacterium]